MTELAYLEKMEELTGQLKSDRDSAVLAQHNYELAERDFDRVFLRTCFSIPLLIVWLMGVYKLSVVAAVPALFINPWIAQLPFLIPILLINLPKATRDDRGFWGQYYVDNTGGRSWKYNDQVENTIGVLLRTPKRFYCSLKWLWERRHRPKPSQLLDPRAERLASLGDSIDDWNRRAQALNDLIDDARHGLGSTEHIITAKAHMQTQRLKIMSHLHALNAQLKRNNLGTVTTVVPMSELLGQDVPDHRGGLSVVGPIDAELDEIARGQRADKQRT